MYGFTPPCFLPPVTVIKYNFSHQRDQVLAKSARHFLCHTHTSVNMSFNAYLGRCFEVGSSFITPGFQEHIEVWFIAGTSSRNSILLQQFTVAFGPFQMVFLILYVWVIKHSKWSLVKWRQIPVSASNLHGSLKLMGNDRRILHLHPALPAQLSGQNAPRCFKRWWYREQSCKPRRTSTHQRVCVCSNLHLTHRTWSNFIYSFEDGNCWWWGDASELWRRSWKHVSEDRRRTPPTATETVS